jgi:hypothetical protein
MASTVHAKLGFMSRDGVAIDTQRPGDVLRAPTRTSDPNVYPNLESHRCAIQDLCAISGFTPNITQQGFEKVRLHHLSDFQQQLAALRTGRHLDPAQAKQLGRALLGRRIPLNHGKSLRVLFVANEGTMMRVTGPNGLIVNAEDRADSGMNHKIGAPAVHGDQDVRGTPVRQMLMGLGPWLLNHEAPDGKNRRSPLFLINLWIPLQQITQPLALMDESSWNRKAHQLRYALPIDNILERSEDRKMNDIWTVLHDPGQRWYFSSEMYNNEAYVFNTLSNPHGATSLPGEDRAEQLYLELQGGIPASPLTLHPDCPAPLRHAIAAMESLLLETPRDATWQQRASVAMDRVVRKSIEMRMLAWIS